MIVRKNSMMTVAIMRGVTSFFIGSVPRARMASICSVTFIEPNSLAMPEALRPETIKLVMTGPISRIIEVETSCPVRESEPNCSRVAEVFSASAIPIDIALRTTIGREPTPIRSACWSISARYRGLRKRFVTERPASSAYSCTAATLVLAKSEGEISSMREAPQPPSS